MKSLIKLLVCSTLGAGCYAHDVPARRPAPERPRAELLAPMHGRYVIRRGGEVIGEERFAITSSAAVWRAEGTIVLERPVHQTRRYALEIDLATREPIAFSVEMELAGETQRARGRRSDDAYFEIDAQTIAGPRSRRIPYGAGTAIELGTPISCTLVLSLLGRTLEAKKPITVRTIAIAMPALDASVLLFGYVLHGHDARGAKIAVAPLGAARPTALWVRADGLPTRVRSWPEEGAPFELELIELYEN